MSEINDLLSHYKKEHSNLSTKLNQVIKENNYLREQQFKTSIDQRNSNQLQNQPQNDFLSKQLLETEQNLSNERQQVVKAMSQVIFFIIIFIEKPSKL